MRILLVDHSSTLRIFQKNTLLSIGYEEIDEASDGVEALAMIRKQRPDLVMVDWNMPRMDGISLVRKVRETDPMLPIIMVTTEADKAHVLQAVQAGVNNYVLKPFTGEMLSQKINQTIAKMGQVQAAQSATATH